MVSLISTASYHHHFIYPKTTTLGLNNIAPLLGFKQISSTTPKIVLVTNKTTSGGGGGGGGGSGWFSSKEEEEELERKVYDFMKNSNTPNHFPTKKHLLDAGRLDLVTAISNTGGWLAFGWEDDDQEDPPPHPTHFDTT
nr:protein PTST homolog 2, chloroplastic-like [Tanacetum cinerariifolium]